MVLRKLAQKEFGLRLKKLMSWSYRVRDWKNANLLFKRRFRGRHRCGILRDLTIRQRRRPWKRRWKIDFASFETFSRLSQSALLLERREFWLELKRGDRARVQTKMIEFISLLFPFSSELKIWSFHVVVVQGQQRNVQKKRDARAELLFCSLNLLLFWRSPYRRRRSFVRSL